MMVISNFNEVKIFSTLKKAAPSRILANQVLADFHDC